MGLVEELLAGRPHVHIHEAKRARVEEILRSLVADGRKLLHVVADFDFTLSAYEHNGAPGLSTFAVIENNERAVLADGSRIGDLASQLRAKYVVIEHDVQLSIEEKTPYMIEWWRKAQDLILASKLDRTAIREVVRESKLELRQGVREFISELLTSQTPILIFSAGLGDVIEIFLEQNIPQFKRNHESSHIVSNFLEFDDDGKLLAFSKKLIHSFNKNEHEIHDSSYYQSILNRPNVILLGDTLGDVGMIGGMKNLKQVLNIGFLNRSTPAKLDAYRSIFDIVICDDHTFDVPNFLLNAIQ